MEDIRTQDVLAEAMDSRRVWQKPSVSTAEISVVTEHSTSGANFYGDGGGFPASYSS